jgi:twitching motility protein PilT
MNNSLDTPVYPVGNALLSLADLLGYFCNLEHFQRGMSRYSDIHLKVGQPVTFRYDGDIQPLNEGALLTAEMIRSLLLPMLREEQWCRLQSETLSDLDASWHWPEKNLCFRLNVFTDRDGVAAVVRALASEIPPIDQIGFPDESVWQDICRLQSGLVLLTGNTGSGKSTTIASLISYINGHRPVRILSLEDPIEYVFKSKSALISQRELGRHISSFSSGLRSALREDPDIILVGEMRDRETILLALTAAETGHLVFSTLHTRDCQGAITRIIDMFPGERTKEVATQLSMSLSYVICQKLVASLEGGRTVAMEILKNTTSVSNIIRTNSLHQIPTVLETQSKDGMITLESHLRILVETGVISVVEAMDSANDPDALQRRLARK